MREEVVVVSAEEGKTQIKMLKVLQKAKSKKKMSRSIILQYIHFQNKRKTCLLEWTGRMWRRRRRQRVCTTTTTQDLEPTGERGAEYVEYTTVQICDEKEDRREQLGWFLLVPICPERDVPHQVWSPEKTLGHCRRLSREMDTITNTMVLC